MDKPTSNSSEKYPALVKSSFIYKEGVVEFPNPFAYIFQLKLYSVSNFQAYKSDTCKEYN
ncbi:UNVERIFIED_CONTAM: hypothetical protein NCL1_40257 [Trichonephila clavipes]